MSYWRILAFVLAVQPTLALAEAPCRAPVPASATPSANPSAEAVVAQTMSGVVRIEAGGAAQRGVGSGFLFDDQGHILTNAHVVAQATSFTVRFADGRSEPAVLIGKDPRIDIAVLRIAPFRGMSPLTFATATPITGASVYAMGSPLGLPISVSRGIVSGLGRAYDVAWPVDFIQHDAAINPGNSGGPLIDATGHVVGINTASPPEAIFDIGIGLAIPADVALRTAAHLIEYGHMERGALGLMVSAADADMVRAIGAGDSAGLLVDQVVPGSAAQLAGLMPGDLIVALGGAPMVEPRDLSFRLLDSHPGETIVLRLVRGSQRLTLPVRLQSDNPDEGGHERAAKVIAGGSGLGLEFGAANGEGKVTITTVAEESVADRLGIANGDLLMAVNGTLVSSPDQALSLIRAATTNVLVLRIERPGRGVRHFAVPLQPRDTALASAAQGRSVGPV